MPAHSTTITPRDPFPLRIVVAIYAAVALVWLALARWVVPPLLAAKDPGPIVAHLRNHIEMPPALFLPRDAVDR
jgi:hypothetical protein